MDPPPCEMEAIVSEITSQCDDLDGRSDGVIARSDLYMLDLHWDSIEGVSYSCSASGSSLAQTGTVTSEAIAVASNIYEGLRGSSSDQVYLSYCYGASFGDAETTYDSSTESWEVSVSSTSADFVQRYQPRGLDQPFS